jgi:hypothetical protein
MKKCIISYGNVCVSTHGVNVRIQWMHCVFDIDAEDCLVARQCRCVVSKHGSVTVTVIVTVTE